jgi:transposase-like protein
MAGKKEQPDRQLGKFDFGAFEQAAIEQLKSGKSLSGKDGILTPLIKRILEQALQGEIDVHLETDQEQPNRKNGKTSKAMQSEYGAFDLETPRDRNSTFEPEIVRKRQTTLGKSVDDKILSLYALGMSYADIANHMEELYGLEISPATLSTITDKIIPVVREWQARPLEEVYPIVWMDAIYYKAKEEGKIVPKAVYTILGLTIKGYKEVLGFYVSEAEGANFWLQVLTDLSNRGVKDILIASIDNLKGFAEAINTIFPQTDVQLCIVHQIRNSLRYVSSKDQRAFLKELKEVYRAATKDLAEEKLKALEETWGKKYPIVIKSWKVNWQRLSQYFKYPEHIRRITYTTNVVEGLHRQIRKVTKTKGAFSSELALTKLLYMAIQNIMKKWTQPVQNWSLTISQLAVFFEGRLHLPLEV